MHFVINHKKLPWEIPFDHVEIGVGGHTPEGKGIKASETIGCNLDQIKAFGSTRSYQSIINEISKKNTHEDIYFSSYRLFLGTNYNQNWTETVPFSERLITVRPKIFSLHYTNIISNKIPDGFDILIAQPIKFNTSILHQYACAHKIEDLLICSGIAVGLNIIKDYTAHELLSKNYLIPFNGFASKAEIAITILSDLWKLALEFYNNKGFKNRTEYQERNIDFCLERICSALIMETIIKHKLRAVSTKPILISDDLVYRPTI
jgi:hypothetical protein